MRGKGQSRSQPDRIVARQAMGVVMQENRRRRRLDPGQQGAALLGALLITVILSLLGSVSMELAVQEIQSADAIRDELVAHHLAEAGSDLVVQWFHDPTSSPSLSASSLFVKRQTLPDGTPSFFDSSGRSQFVGTPDQPDLLYDATRPEDDRLLNDIQAGWFRSLRALGRILRLKVYGPSRPGLLCSVEITAAVAGKGGPGSTGGSGELMKTLVVQLGARSIPSLKVGVQVGDGTGVPGRPTALPLWVHWGDIKVKGEAWFGSPNELPQKTDWAPVTGQSYADLPFQEDRWLDLWVGGEALFMLPQGPVSGSRGLAVPSNLFPRQDPVPGLQQQGWDYEVMKKQALLFGSYYLLGRDGLLYRNGVVSHGLGQTPEAVFGSQAVGDHHGLVFVDTLDQRPPSGGNLGGLVWETDYAEGIFVIHAHIHFKPKGPGQSVPALSPPPEGSSSFAKRIPVQLTGIHLQGVIYSTGTLTFEGQPRMFGALSVDGNVVQSIENKGIFEIWYNYDLQNGLSQGMPLVFIAPGTWQEKT